MEVFFPVGDDERDALLARRFQRQELYGQERIEWDCSGADEDAIWVAAEVDDAVAERYENSDGKYLGYRPFTFPRDLLNQLAWRVAGPGEVSNARRAEAEEIKDWRERQRADAIEAGQEKRSGRHR